MLDNNRILKNILDNLDLTYEEKNLGQEEGSLYFELEFEESHTGEEHSLFIIYLEDINALSFLVPNITLVPKNKINEVFYHEINLLNLTATFGSVFYILENDPVIVSYNHTVTLTRDNTVISKEEVNDIIDYIGFFVGEIRESLKQKDLLR